MFFTKTKLFEYLCRNEFVIKRSRKIKKKKKRHVQKISPFSDTFLFIYSFTETENKTKENLITIKIFLPKSVTTHHSISKIHFSSKHKTPEEKPPLKGDKISPSKWRKEKRNVSLSNAKYHGILKQIPLPPRASATSTFREEQKQRFRSAGSEST